MSPFGFSRTIAIEETLDTIRDHLNTLDSHVATSQADVRAMKLEWETTYEKIHKALQRLNKRARDAAKAEDDSDPVDADSRGVGGRSEFEERILKRRAKK